MQVENKNAKLIQLIHGKPVEEVLRRAVRHALLVHKRAGNPIAEWRDGQVVIIPPEAIQVDDPLEKKSE